MFNNIGLKIKVLSIILFIFETLAFILYGVILFIKIGFIGLLPMLAGPITAFIVLVFSYGFGELVENSEIQREYLYIISRQKHKEYDD